MRDDLILEALQKGVIAAMPESSIPLLPVKYLGRLFTPPSDDKWLELVFIPNNVEDEFWSDGKTYQGLFRLILHWPMNDEGVYTPMQVLKSITAYFSKGRTLQNVAQTIGVKVTDHPNLLSVLEMPPELLLPASIRYSFFDA